MSDVGVDLGRELVAAIRQDVQDEDEARRLGLRPVHAFGTGCTGWFQANDDAKRYTRAAHFQGGRIPVTVRFSNGSGVPVEHDRAEDVRGMAVKFHLGTLHRDQTGLLRGETETDMVAMTLPVFFVKTPEDFFEFCQAARLRPPERVPWWRKALDAAQLKLPLTEEPEDVTLSAKAGILAFTDEHEEARSAVAFMHSIVTPTSYVQAMYSAVHAFRLVNAEGVACYARFTWEPVAGVSRQKDLDEAVTGPDLDLHDELPGRLAQWPAQFMLRAQLAELGDDVTDPTTPFKDTRPRLALGLLTIEAMAGDDGRGCEHLSFNPTRLVDGVECSGDKILEARRWAYAESCRQRGGEGCEVAAP